MNECMVNEQGEMLEILQEDREPFEGEFKVPLAGYYEVFNEQHYQEAKYDFDNIQWVGVGEPIPVPEPQQTEIYLLSNEIAQQNQTISELMDLLFTTVPELAGI